MDSRAAAAAVVDVGTGDRRQLAGTTVTAERRTGHAAHADASRATTATAAVEGRVAEVSSARTLTNGSARAQGVVEGSTTPRPADRRSLGVPRTTVASAHRRDRGGQAQPRRTTTGREREGIGADLNGSRAARTNIDTHHRTSGDRRIARTHSAAATTTSDPRSAATTAGHHQIVDARHSVRNHPGAAADGLELDNGVRSRGVGEWRARRRVRRVTKDHDARAAVAAAGTGGSVRVAASSSATTGVRRSVGGSRGADRDTRSAATQTSGTGGGARVVRTAATTTGVVDGGAGDR